MECGTSLRFWENKGWINEIDPYGWFKWFQLSREKKNKSKDNQKKIVSVKKRSVKK